MDPTADSDAPKRHTNNDIWSQIHDQGKRIHDQGKQIAGLQTGLGKLESRVEGGFSGLSSQIQGVLTQIQRIDRPPDTLRQASLILTGLVVLGSIALLVIVPMQERQRLSEERQWEIHGQQQYERGYQDATRARP